MMIAVTGGAGVLGSRLVKGLVSSGNRIRVLTLPGDPFVSRLHGLGCEIFYGDVADKCSLEGAFKGVNTVYHLAAVIIASDPGLYRKVNVGGTQNVVDAAICEGVSHFILVSSAAAVDGSDSEYARSKIAAEKIVCSQEKMYRTILRPTLIYDTDGGQEFTMFVDYLKRYPVVPFVGRGQAKKQPVYAADIVAGLIAVANNPQTYGKTYNLSGAESISIWDLAHLILKYQGISKPFVPIPLSLCRLVASLSEKILQNPALTRYAISRIEKDADLDNLPARQDLGYNPLGVREGFARCFTTPV